MDIFTFIILLLLIIISSYFAHCYFSERKKAREFYELNTKVDNSTQFDAVEEHFKKFDSRLNATWEAIGGVKASIELLKVQIGFKKI